MNSQKIVSLEALPGIVAELRNAGKKIVTTNGAFDMLHVGHVHALEQSRTLGDVLIVGVNSDASVKQYKSPLRPIIPQAQRAEMLAALSCVDYVAIFDEEKPMKFIEAVRPDVHAKQGYDVEKMYESELVRSLGGRLVALTGVPSASTTGIIDRILSAYCSVRIETNG